MLTLELDIGSMAVRGGASTPAAPVWPFTVQANDVHFDFGDTSLAYQESTETTPAAANSPVGAVRNKFTGTTPKLLQATAGQRPLARLKEPCPGDLLFDSSNDGFVWPTSMVVDRRNFTMAWVVKYAGNTTRCIFNIGGNALALYFDAALGGMATIKMWISGSSPTTLYTTRGIASLVLVGNGTNLTLYYGKESHTFALPAAGTFNTGFVGLWSDGGSFPYDEQMLAATFQPYTLPDIASVRQLQDYLTATYGAMAWDCDIAIGHIGDGVREGNQGVGTLVRTEKDTNPAFRLERLCARPPKWAMYADGGAHAATIPVANLNAWMAAHSAYSKRPVLAGPIGTNDLDGGMSVADMKTTLNNLYASITGETHVIATTILPRSTTATNDKITEVNDWLKAGLSAVGTNVVDYTAVPLLTNLGGAGFQDGDGHPSDLGMQAMAMADKAKLVSMGLLT